tara:strand:+ start:934 stop:1236 length:303 start_codon:yes stop_codon:yes gene_type:complete
MKNTLHILRGPKEDARAKYIHKRKFKCCFEVKQFDENIKAEITDVLKVGKEKTVVISGKFDQFYLMAPYLALGRKYQYDIEVLRLPDLRGNQYDGEIYVC